MKLKKGDVVELKIDEDSGAGAVVAIVIYVGIAFVKLLIGKSDTTFSATKRQIKETGINIFELIKIKSELTKAHLEGELHECKFCKLIFQPIESITILQDKENKPVIVSCPRCGSDVVLDNSKY